MMVLEPPEAEGHFLNGRLVVDFDKFEVFSNHYMNIMFKHKKRLRDHIIQNNVPRRSRRVKKNPKPIYYPEKKIKRSDSVLSITSQLPIMQFAALKARRNYEIKKIVLDPYIIIVSDDEDEETKLIPYNDIPSTANTSIEEMEENDDEIEEIDKSCVQYVPHGWCDEMRPEPPNFFENHYANGQQTFYYPQYSGHGPPLFMPQFVPMNGMDGHYDNENPPFTSGPAPLNPFEGMDCNLLFTLFTSYVRNNNSNIFNSTMYNNNNMDCGYSANYSYNM